MPTSKQAQSFLLDTHVWIWLVNGEKRMERGPLVQRLRESPAPSFRVSVLSVWEVGMLEAKGRIELPLGCLEWVQRALEAPGMALVPLTAEIAVASNRLPGVFHGDPVDRVLVATARSLAVTLVTQDSQILAYSKQHRLSVISAF